MRLVCKSRKAKNHFDFEISYTRQYLKIGSGYKSFDGGDLSFIKL